MTKVVNLWNSLYPVQWRSILIWLYQHQQSSVIFFIFFLFFAKNVLCPQQCELYHWVDLLDRFDGILCDAGQTVENMSWLLVCDRPDNGQLKALLLAVLNFTALLIEYSFSRHLYSSIEVRSHLERSSPSREFSLFFWNTLQLTDFLSANVCSHFST